MPFEKPLLGWNATGVEPPISLKDKGWEAQQKPPAPYFNWAFHLLDQALKEFQGNAIHKEVIGKAGGVAELDVNGKVLNADGTSPGEVTKLQFDTHTGQAATTLKVGHVQLSDAVTSTDVTKAATSNAVKKAYDRAEAAFTSASNGKTAITNAVTGADPRVVVPADPTFTDLASAIARIKTGAEYATGSTRSYFNASHYRLEVVGLAFQPEYLIAYASTDKLAVGRRGSTYGAWVNWANETGNDTGAGICVMGTNSASIQVDFNNSVERVYSWIALGAV